MAVLIASALRKEFSGEPLFDAVSFKIERRDRLALAGPNGSGKTTLLRALLGLIPLEQGTALIDGRPVAQLGPIDPGTTAPTLEDLAARDLVRLPRRPDREPPDAAVDVWAGFRLDRLLRDIR